MQKSGYEERNVRIDNIGHLCYEESRTRELTKKKKLNGKLFPERVIIIVLSSMTIGPVAIHYE